MKMRSLEGVEGAEKLFREYDAIVKLKAAKINKIENLVVDQNKKIACES